VSNLVQCSKAISALSPSTSLLASAARPLITQLSLFISCHNTRCDKNMSLKRQEKDVSCFSSCPCLYTGEMGEMQSPSKHFLSPWWINVAVVILIFLQCLLQTAFMQAGSLK